MAAASCRAVAAERGRAMSGGGGRTRPRYVGRWRPNAAAPCRAVAAELCRAVAAERGRAISGGGAERGRTMSGGGGRTRPRYVGRRRPNAAASCRAVAAERGRAMSGSGGRTRPRHVGRWRPRAPCWVALMATVQIAKFKFRQYLSPAIGGQIANIIPAKFSCYTVRHITTNIHSQVNRSSLTLYLFYHDLICATIKVMAGVI